MAGIEFDFTDSSEDLSQFPDGWYSGKLVKAETQVSSKGNSMFVVDIEIEHPTLGSAVLRDWIVPTFKPKARAFFRAYHGMSAEELRQYLTENGVSHELSAMELVNARMMVHVGSEEGKDGQLRKTVTAGYYASQDQTDLIQWMAA